MVARQAAWHRDTNRSVFLRTDGVFVTDEAIARLPDPLAREMLQAVLREATTPQEKDL